MSTNVSNTTIGSGFDTHGEQTHASPDIRRHDAPIVQAEQEKPDGKGIQQDAPAKEVSKEAPFSIFKSSEKWFIVTMASLAGIFSPLTANIYFPAIPVMSTEFHKSVELINLTVTVYMIMQGVSPMFWGTMSDRWGRRPMFFGCILLLALSCVGLALTPTSDYWLLMLLRCIQAAGSASTIALGAGVIADIATPAERGGFFGLVSFGPMVGPSIGPVIGGALTQGLGWRSIFWFLCISSGVCLVAIFLFLPETLRSMVGNGSYLPPLFWRPVIPLVGKGRQSSALIDRPPTRPFDNPLRLFLYPDVVILLVLNGVIYATFYGVTASISILFEDVYPFLNQTDIGLCFLGIGGGMAIGSLFTGRVLDREYRSIENRLIREGKFDPEKKMSARERASQGDFPLEVARLRLVPAYLLIYLGCIIGYGWCLEARVSIAGPLILSVFIGYVLVSVMNCVQTLLVDLTPAQGSSITACNNLVRCCLGAAMVSVINIMINSLNVGWTYVVLAGLCVAVTPLLWVEFRWGPVWRARRLQRQQAGQH